MRISKGIFLFLFLLAGCTYSPEINSSKEIATALSPHTNTPNAIILETPQEETPPIINTKSPQFTSTPSVNEKMGVIVLWPDKEIVLFDFQTGESSSIYSDENAVFLDWINNGCEVLVGTTRNPSGSVIFSLDLNGNIGQEFARYEYKNSDKFNTVYDISLSPSHEYAAYILAHMADPSDRDVSLFNLIVTPFDDPSSKTILADNDGAYEAKWSSDSLFIAYTDYDVNGVHQLYVATPDGSVQQQLTHFDNPDHTISSLAWSPDNQHLAFAYISTNDSESNMIMVINLSDPDTEEMTEIINVNDEKIYSVQNIWWENKVDIVIDIIYRSDGTSKSGLFWIDSISGNVIKQLLQNDIDPLLYPWDKLIHYDQFIGFIQWPQLWLVDVDTKDIVYQIKNPVDLISNWYLAPDTFPGKTFCEDK